VTRRTIDAPPAPERRVFSERSAYWVASILSDDAAREPGFGRGGPLEFDFPVAAKTGTSEAYHDNWALGVSRDFAVGVWVGNFDRTPLRRSSGITGAAPIFHAVMEAAVERAVKPGDEGTFAVPPDGLLPREICALSGLGATAACPVRTEEELAHDAALPHCDWHSFENGESAVRWPARFAAWAAERWSGGVGEGLRGPRGEGEGDGEREGATGASETAAFRIVSPPAGAVYLRDATLRPDRQLLPLRTTGVGARTEIEWRVDGESAGRSRGGAAAHWQIRPGRHTVEARAGRRRTSVEIEVR
jgi:penicillin-binding protein 1C